jgi:hypothetical protein
VEPGATPLIIAWMPCVILIAAWIGCLWYIRRSPAVVRQWLEGIAQRLSDDDRK